MTGAVRIIRGERRDTAAVVSQAIDEARVSEQDLSNARQALARMGHSQPATEMIARYAREQAILAGLERITGASVSGQTGRWNMTTTESIVNEFNRYLDRRNQGMRAAWTQRGR
jgi:hypothetical protein